MLFLKSGILTTIQDLGRNGFRSLGINPNGVMDKYAMRKINILLENNENEAVLEMHFPAPEILFEEAAVFAISGADFLPMIDNQPITNLKLFFVRAGSVLKFQKKLSGERAYLSVRGGFEVEKWLNSTSTNIVAKIGGKQIENGTRLCLKNSNFEGVKILSKVNIAHNLNFQSFNKIRIIVGNEFQFLKPVSRQLLENQEFTITKDGNRMGYKLDGNPLNLISEFSLLSSAVDFGTIQLLPNGQLIILMADHQTSGGYPRIGNIISVDLPILAQSGVGTKFKFKIISIAEAETLYLKYENEILKLKASIRLFSKQ